MKTFKSLAVSSVVAVFVIGTAGCSGMSTQDKYTVGGAAAGGVAGSVLTGGSTLGTVGGAAAGGLIGREVGKNK